MKGSVNGTGLLFSLPGLNRKVLKTALNGGSLHPGLQWLDQKQNAFLSCIAKRR